jgi:hypothetical protein
MRKRKHLFQADYVNQASFRLPENDKQYVHFRENNIKKVKIQNANNNQRPAWKIQSSDLMIFRKNQTENNNS